MQAQYPNKLHSVHWDAVNLNYPVRKYPSTELSSETIARKWKCPQQMVKNRREPIEEIKEYFRDYNVTKELTKSQTAKDFRFKLPETKRFYKHVSCAQNHYIYPPSRKLDERPPRCSAHGKTETQSSYIVPIKPSRLVTEKDQFRHPASLNLDAFPVESSYKNDVAPIDTTYEGYEKYLDPYLTTNRLYHRPYTDDQLERISCSKDIVTYYTFANVSWKVSREILNSSFIFRAAPDIKADNPGICSVHKKFTGDILIFRRQKGENGKGKHVVQTLLCGKMTRTPPPKADECFLTNKKPKSLYDTEIFKNGFREIRTHNKLQFVPGTFRTESGENYMYPMSAPVSKIHNYEEEVKSFYTRKIADLESNIEQESSDIKSKYPTENSLYGSRKPLCLFFNPFIEKNKRLRM